MAKKKNKKKIKKLKDKLAQGNLSQKKLDKIIGKIKDSGGKVNKNKFPGAKEPSTFSGKAGDKAISKGLGKGGAKDAKLGDALGQKFLPNVDAIGGLVDENRSDEMNSLLKRFEEQANTAGQRPEDIQAIIDKMQGGLGGLMADEQTAIREASQRELDRDLATQRRALASLQGASGVRGAAGGAQFRDLARERFRAQQQMEQDLQVQNIDIQNQRREYLSKFLGDQTQNEFERGAEALRNFGDATTFARGDELNRQLLNDEQMRRLAAGRAGLWFGGVDLGQSRRNDNRNFRLAQDNVNIARDFANRPQPDFSNLFQFQQPGSLQNPGNLPPNTQPIQKPTPGNTGFAPGQQDPNSNIMFGGK